LVQLLNIKQAQAKQSGASAEDPDTATISWEDLSSALQNIEAPSINYEKFDKMYAKDPKVKSLIDRYDGKGLTLKVGTQLSTSADSGQSSVTAAAKSATKRAMGS